MSKLKGIKFESSTVKTKVGEAPILCHKCGNPIVFDKDHITPSGRKIPLEPSTNGERHDLHCIYSNIKLNKHTEALFTDFLLLVPRKKRVIGAVGRSF